MVGVKKEERKRAKERKGEPLYISTVTNSPQLVCELLHPGNVSLGCSHELRQARGGDGAESRDIN